MRFRLLRLLLETDDPAVVARDEALDESFPLPALTDRPFVSVRLESSDYVLVDVTRGTCSAFLLERIELR